MKVYYVLFELLKSTITRIIILKLYNLSNRGYIKIEVFDYVVGGVLY